MYYKLTDELIRLTEEMEFGYIVVLVDTKVLDKYDIEMLQEGRWSQSKKKDWYCRIDPSNPQLKQQRHVHIARSEHINTKNMQVAWNSDGTRHDRMSFNQNIRGMKTAKKIARDALGLSNDIVIECANNIEEDRFLNESTSNLMENSQIDPVLLVALLSEN